MGDTKDEIYRQINVLYEKFDSKNVRNTWYFIIGASIFLDIVLSIKKSGHALLTSKWHNCSNCCCHLDVYNVNLRVLSWKSGSEILRDSSG